MVRCYECKDRQAVPQTNRGLCTGCDPQIDTSEDAVIAAIEELKAEMQALSRGERR